MKSAFPNYVMQFHSIHIYVEVSSSATPFISPHDAILYANGHEENLAGLGESCVGDRGRQYGSVGYMSLRFFPETP